MAERGEGGGWVDFFSLFFVVLDGWEGEVGFDFALRERGRGFAGIERRWADGGGGVYWG